MTFILSLHKYSEYLDEKEPVNTRVVIGPRAKKPLKVNSPVVISGMSLGATSRNVRLVVSQVAAKLRIAYNTGEGGMLEEELPGRRKLLIGQFTTYTDEVDTEVIKRVAAVEIRFGQGAYPGKGSYLPENKMSPAFSEARGLNGVERAYSPAHHAGMMTSAQIRAKVLMMREMASGVPIGAKIGCGNVEKDIRVLVDADVDFIALDGFGGGTGATEMYARENVGIPIVVALPRAVKQLKRRLWRQCDPHCWGRPSNLSRLCEMLGTGC